MILPCTHCGKNLDDPQVHIVATLQSARILQLCQWAFCSVDCRDTWWNEPAGPMFVAHAPANFPTCEKCAGTKRKDQRGDGRDLSARYHELSDRRKVEAISASEHDELRDLADVVCRACSHEGKATPVFICSHDPAHEGHAFDRDVELRISAVAVPRWERRGDQSVLVGDGFRLIDGKFGCPCDINDYWASDEEDVLSPKTEEPTADVAKETP